MTPQSDLSPQTEDIKYTYFHWGPFLLHTKITKKECDTILEEGQECRRKSNDYRHSLAGHLSEEYQLKNEKVMAVWLKNYFNVYASAYNKWRGGGRMNPNFTLTSLWINYMKANEFNPPHVHGGDLSFVIYPDIPNQIIKENKAYKGTQRGPGGISWMYYGQGDEQCITMVRRMPQTGDLFIFPACLTHWVFPFKSKVERISVSGNVLFDPNSKVDKDGLSLQE